MTKTIKELLDETIDERLKWIIKGTGADYESLVGLISQVEALVRKQTVEEMIERLQEQIKEI